MAVNRRRTRGCGLVELLLGVALGLGVLAGLLGALAAGSAALTRAGARTETSDTLQLATEALLFDVRRAGYDPTASGVEAVTEAAHDALTLQADLDGDGAVDGGSSEHVRYVCNPAGGRLSRIVGAQSMPLAAGLGTCRLDYADDAGAAMTVPAGGLDAAARARARVVTLSVGMVHAGGATPTMRRLTVPLERPW